MLVKLHVQLQTHTNIYPSLVTHPTDAQRPNPMTPLGSSGMRYLVGLNDECNITVVNAMKDFLVHARNKRQRC
ncbi:hypothetical protein FHG87_005599 [Trinorchestia longiramus]|nr:hypothetical protein FHG87_005599 [Trinorchestia longiramus]